MRDNPGESPLRSYDHTGTRLFVLGLMLLLVLALVAVPMAVAVLYSLPTFIERSEGGPVLAGAFASLGLAVAGMFFGAARMLKALPAILRSRHVPGAGRDAYMCAEQSHHEGVGQAGSGRRPQREADQAHEQR